MLFVLARSFVCIIIITITTIIIIIIIIMIIVMIMIIITIIIVIIYTNMRYMRLHVHMPVQTYAHTCLSIICTIVCWSACSCTYLQPQAHESTHTHTQELVISHATCQLARHTCMLSLFMLAHGLRRVYEFPSTYILMPKLLRTLRTERPVRDLWPIHRIGLYKDMVYGPNFVVPLFLKV